MSAPKRAKMSAAPASSWLPVTADSEFPIHNIPFGVAVLAGVDGARCVTRIGDAVIDLHALAHLFPESYRATLTATALNDFMAAGRPAWRDARCRIQALFAGDGETDADDTVRNDAALRAVAVRPLSDAVMQLPARIGDYTDFYSSREHATNVGIMFRGVDNALQPNWLHLPVGYHGRSSSVVVTGTDFRRPCGQLQIHPTDATLGSSYGPTKQLDFELEVGAFIGPGNAMGEPIDIATAEDHIFGLVLLNDWSARDIQKWEYVPLGPFGAKNFCTTISPWVVTLDALEPFRCATSAGEQTAPVPLPYLRDPKYGSYDINLRVTVEGAGMSSPATICSSNFRHLYWSIRQQLVHHTVTGCNMRPGDLLGSGTISGQSPDSYGSLLELTWKGTKPLELPDGSKRIFLQDGDTVDMRGWCERDGVRIGFGHCTGTVLPAKPYVAPADVDGAAGGAGVTTA